MPFTLPFDSIKQRSAQYVLDVVIAASKKRVSDIRIYDLLYENDQPISTGVYLFFAPDSTLLYAGKTQRFVERIPWHFALGEGSWMNHFLRYTREHKGVESLKEAADAAREDNLLLIPVNEWDLVQKLERFFRIFGKCKYNSLSANVQRRYRSIDLSISILEVLRKL